MYNVGTIEKNENRDECTSLFREKYVARNFINRKYFTII